MAKNIETPKFHLDERECNKALPLFDNFVNELKNNELVEKHLITAGECSFGSKSLK